MNITLKDLSEKLKHLAEQHAYALTNHNHNKITIAEGEFNLKEIYKAVLSLDYFKAFDNATIEQIFNSLEATISNLINYSVVTKSTHSKKRMPVAFDVLVEIFIGSSEEFRQQYFQELTTLYYEELCKSLQKLESDVIFDRVNYDEQVKFLLPYVKLSLIFPSLEDSIFNAGERKEQLLSNIGLYFKFPRINQEDIYQVAKNRIGSTNFNIQSYELIPLDAKNGHLGEYFKLKLIVNIGEDMQQFNLFAKFLTPKSEDMKKLALSGASKKEDFFYMTYIPLLETFGIKLLPDFAPRCYFSRINDVLILDDMTANGFVGVTPNTLLEYAALSKVVQKIANFHAATMVLEEMLSEQEQKRITLNDLYAEFLQEAFFVPDDDYFFKHNFDIALNTIIYTASKFPDETKKYSEEVLKEKINKGWKLHFKKLGKSDTLKNTLCHGDMYVANMLFKYDSEKVCQDVSLVDFQVFRYCPPTHDLLFFLYQSCTKETRSKCLRQLCDQYYDDLSKNVESFGYDINKIYPKEDFEKSLEYIKSQAVFQAFFYSPLMMITPKLREDIFSNQEKLKYYLQENRSELVDILLEDDTYKTVMKGLVEDIVELCENSDL